MVLHWVACFLQVVGLGVRGVFTIIQDIWRSNPELCLRALRELLNILQGQSPAGLKDEPRETTGRKQTISFCQGPSYPHSLSIPDSAVFC